MDAHARHHRRRRRVPRRRRRPDQPFFLWLHYVNPHAPYTPPPPYDTAFLDDGGRATGPAAARRGRLPRRHPARSGRSPGQDRLGYYVAQYDGEIAAVDQEVGKVLDALDRSPAAGRTLVVITSDHGESLGEHDYYFDHGQDVFDPCLRIPLLVALPGAPPARAQLARSPARSTSCPRCSTR